MRTIGVVTVNGEAVTQHQRALVAALALHRQTGATVDHLVDAMWGDRAPTTARKSVQNQIARLRQQFGSDIITTSGDRYLLDVRTDLDAIDDAGAQFDAAHASAAEIAALAGLLSECRSLPFADLVDDCGAVAEQARFELVRSRLVESLALALLRNPLDVEATTEAIVQLTVRTSHHPLHERAWELLVSALHISGRRTEALGVYAQFVDVLDRQLGVAPSPAFRALRDSVDADQMCDVFALFGQRQLHEVAPLKRSA